MMVVLKISDKLEEDEADHTLSTPRQQAFNEFMKWQLFREILHSVCITCGWTILYEDDTDSSLAIFADTIGADDLDSADEEPSFDLPF